MAKPSSRPSFSAAWTAFLAVRVPVADVGKKVGGAVEKNINMPLGGFENACPIRMSYVLNSTGFPIPKSHSYASVSGADQKQYIYRVGDMTSYLERTFGTPDKVAKSPKTSDFTDMKGILVVKGHGWGNAKGHITLWDGTQCADTCHLLYDPENGPFVPETASLWVLQ